MKKPIIYTSKHLRTTPETVRVAEAISVALGRLNIGHRELENTNDYWCRDYMPVKISEKGIYAKYNYSPDYLVDYKTKRQYITKQVDVCQELDIFAPVDLGIVFDGGNYVRCDDKVIMTDKIFMENPTWTARDLINHLSESLNADIILLPWDMKDICGHSDGMVSYLGDNRILLNSCWRNVDKPYYKRLLKILQPNFEIVEPVYGCKENIHSWCYLNYLQLSNALLLPVLSEKADCENDVAAIEYFEGLFPNLKVIPIYALPLIKKGGALHCVTWEYIEQK
jgi:agmatine/peptidylarginine deiminase